MRLIHEASIREFRLNGLLNSELAGSIGSLEYQDEATNAASILQLNIVPTAQSNFHLIKGDQLRLMFGYKGDSRSRWFDTGLVVVDEITWTHDRGKHFYTVGCRAYDYKMGVNSSQSLLFADDLLANVVKNAARKFAPPGRDSLIVVGNIDNYLIGTKSEGKSYYRFTAVSWLDALKKLADNYGYAFSLKNDQLIFTKWVDLDSLQVVASYKPRFVIGETEFKEKTHNIFQTARVAISETPISEQWTRLEFETVSAIDSSVDTENSLDLTVEGVYPYKREFIGGERLFNDPEAYVLDDLEATPTVAYVEPTEDATDWAELYPDPDAPWWERSWVKRKEKFTWKTPQKGDINPFTGKAVTNSVSHSTPPPTAAQFSTSSQVVKYAGSEAAVFRSRGALLSANRLRYTARMRVIGENVLLARSNVFLAFFDFFENAPETSHSGMYQIERATHRIDFQRQWTCDLLLRRIF